LAVNDLILTEPYASNMEGALRARLVEDGWIPALVWTLTSTCWSADIWRKLPDAREGEAYNAHPLLALAYAAERAGAFDQEKSDGQ